VSSSGLSSYLFFPNAVGPTLFRDFRFLCVWGCGGGVGFGVCVCGGWGVWGGGVGGGGWGGVFWGGVGGWVGGCCGGGGGGGGGVGWWFLSERVLCLFLCCSKLGAGVFCARSPFPHFLTDARVLGLIEERSRFFAYALFGRSFPFLFFASRYCAPPFCSPSSASSLPLQTAGKVAWVSCYPPGALSLGCFSLVWTGRPHVPPPIFFFFLTKA